MQLPEKLPFGTGDQEGWAMAGLPEVEKKINEIIEYLGTIPVSYPSQSKDY